MPGDALAQHQRDNHQMITVCKQTEAERFHRAWYDFIGVVRDKFKFRRQASSDKHLGPHRDGGARRVSREAVLCGVRLSTSKRREMAREGGGAWLAKSARPAPRRNRRLGIVARSRLLACETPCRARPLRPEKACNQRQSCCPIAEAWYGREIDRAPVFPSR